MNEGGASSNVIILVAQFFGVMPSIISLLPSLFTAWHCLHKMSTLFIYLHFIIDTEQQQRRFSPFTLNVISVYSRTFLLLHDFISVSIVKKEPKKKFLSKIMKSENENDTFHIFNALQVGECSEINVLDCWNPSVLFAHKLL